MGMARFLDAAASTGDRSAARTLVGRVAPYASQIITPAGSLILGATARPLARAATILGDYDRAEDWFAMTHDIHARIQTPFFSALGRLDHADLCLTRLVGADIRRARDLATAAATIAAEYGCAGLTKRAETLLAQLQ
ncbi:MAG TPA: hypothetical protein VGN51_25490, partial [Acidimicrobiia bacterium]